MSSPMVILVEDDPRIRRLVETELSRRGYRVSSSQNGEEALRLLADSEPNVMLLDVGLPDMSGVEVCRQVRQWSSVPIIMLTVDDQPESKVTALNAGADDYVTKPFHMSELEARIRAVTRRVVANASEPVLQFADYSLDLPRRQLLIGGELIHLTRTEFELLKTLVLHPGRVLTFDFLLNAVWGPSYDDIRSVHVHISKLRRKLEAAGPVPYRLIHSVPGVGYRFEAVRHE